MQVKRYIRIYYKHRDVQAYQLALPSDSLTFLSTVDFYRTMMILYYTVFMI